MDNQQERLLSLEFIGGLVTGEGCFSLNVIRNRGRGLLHPIFYLFMVDKDAVELVYESMRHHSLPCYFETRRRKPPNKEQYGIRASGYKRMKQICEVLGPHLLGDKAKACQIMHEFVDYRLSLGRGGRGNPQPYSYKDIEFLERLRGVNNGGSHRYPIEKLPSILRDYTPCPSDSEGEDIVQS